MTTNLGTADRAIRLGVAVVAAVAAWVLGPTSVAGIGLLALAAVLAVTAVVGFCPLYRLLGISTVRRTRAVAPSGGATS